MERKKRAMTLDHLLVIILVGLVAGFLASHLVAGHGYGLVGDIIVGILGALIGFLLIGDWLAVHVLAPLGVDGASVLAQILIAFVGAAILLAILRLVGRTGCFETTDVGKNRTSAPLAKNGAGRERPFSRPESGSHVVTPAAKVMWFKAASSLRRERHG